MWLFFYFHMEKLCPNLLSESCQYMGTIFFFFLRNQSGNFQWKASCSGDWCAQAFYCVHHKIKEIMKMNNYAG